MGRDASRIEPFPETEIFKPAAAATWPEDVAAPSVTRDSCLQGNSTFPCTKSSRLSIW